ncbi:MAG: amidohydrolase family protein [Bacteroidales bacterium]|nr:amidohydrolase family protein [Bacteroidales bacterium]
MKRFAAQYVYTLDSPEPIRGGFVEVEDDGTVIRTGKAAEDESLQPGAIVPGFVNTHCHVELSNMWKLLPKGTGMAGFIDGINELRDTKTKEEKTEDIRHWMNLMWDRGVQAMADISNGDLTFPIKAASPMYTRTFLEVFGIEPEDCPSVMESVRALAAEASSFGLDAAPTPHSCYTMSPQLLSASAADGLRSGFLSFHSEESPQEERMMMDGTGELADNRRKYGMTLPPPSGTSSLEYFLTRLSAAHPAPYKEHILLVHEVCMSEDGVRAVKAVMKHPFIALCPMSNIFIHNQLPPVRMLRDSGIPLTVGTDSLSSNDDLDMVTELFCLQQNFPEIPLGELLGWACLNGALFLGKEAIFGSLTPGKRPGIVHIGGLSTEGRLTTASSSRRLI